MQDLDKFRVTTALLPSASIMNNLEPNLGALQDYSIALSNFCCYPEV